MHRALIRLLKQILRPFTRHVSFLVLCRYQKDLDALFSRILSPEQMRTLPDSWTLLKHLTQAKREHISYVLDARRQLKQLGVEIKCPPEIPEFAKRKYVFSTRRLKVLFISGAFPSIEHGGGLRLFDILSELSREHQVDLYTKFRERHDLASLELLKRKIECSRLCCSQEPNEQELKTWLQGRGIPKEHYDIVQLEYPDSVKFLEVARTYGRRIGFTLMECMTRSNCMSLLSASQDNPLELGLRLAQLLEIGSIECVGMRGSDVSIAVSPEDAHFASRVAPVRPEVVPTCVSPRFLDECKSPKVRDQVAEGPSAAFVGYFDHYPNVEGMSWYIRHIHPAVVSAVPNFKLLVIGKGDTSCLKALSRDDPSIVFTGRVEDLPLHIRRAEICIAPLISGAGIRGKINQYSVCDRPTVSTTLGAAGMPYVSGETIFIADQPEEFSRRMIELLRNHALRARMVKGAKQVVEKHFCWPQSIRKLESIYHSL